MKNSSKCKVPSRFAQGKQSAKLHFKIKNLNKIQEIFIFNQSDDAKLEYPIYKENQLLELFVFFNLHDNNVLKLKTLTKHLVESTSAFTYVIGVVNDSASAYHEGMIKITKTGQLTNAYLKSAILLIGKNSQAESIPSLEIEANNVKASHSSSIGKPDSEQLFYLQSRGLSKSEAEKLLIEGFFEPYLEKIDSLPIREKVRKLLL